MGQRVEIESDMPDMDLLHLVVESMSVWPTAYRREGQRILLAIGEGFRGSRDEIKNFLSKHQELVALGWQAFWPDSKGKDQEWSDFDSNLLFIPSICVEILAEGASRAVFFAPDEEMEELRSQFAALVLGAQERGERQEWKASSVQNGPRALLDELGKEGFQEAVREITEKVQFPKIVLARRFVLRWTGELQSAAVLRFLEENYGECTVYCISPRPGGPFFVGATPERLVELKENQIQTMALAGTIGSDEEGDKLLQSSKDEEEHLFVLNYIKEKLESFTDVVHSGEREVLSLPNVRHLMTPLRAMIKPEKSLFDVVDALHPTPAVCGMPTAQVRPLIREYEGFDRGLYAGTFGYIDGTGEGRFDVLLRCALVEEKSAIVYAGAGITAESTVEGETVETARKAEAMLGALNAALRVPDGRGLSRGEER